MMMNAISQPNHSANGGIDSGATRAPTDAPALKIDVENARSFFGKYSAVTLIAAGKFPDSPIANTERQNRKRYTLMVAIDKAVADPACTARSASTESRPSYFIVIQPHTAWRHAPSDHTKIDQRYPFLVPIQSINLPANRQNTAYRMENTAVIVP